MFEYGLQLGQLTIFYVYWTIILGKILVLRFDTKNVSKPRIKLECPLLPPSP